MASKKLKLDCREETGEGQASETGNFDGLPQEVLNMIFNHLPAADLFSCSIMSKNWKKASRDVLKRNRECYAHIKHFRRDVRSLNDMIVSTDLLEMINGLHIQIMPKYNPRKAASSSSWRQEFSCSYAENKLQLKETRRMLERAKRKIQAVLSAQWKNLNLDMGNYWKQLLSLDDALLLRELISATSESLQKLMVGQDEDSAFLSCCGKKFPKVKVLHAESGGTVNKSYFESFVLESVPNLEEITGAMLVVEVYSPVNPFVLNRMKSIMVAADVYLEEELMEGFRSISGLRRLNLKLYEFSTFDDLSVLFSMVLKSMNTLQELRMRTLEFYRLFETSNELSFPNLRRLTLATRDGMPKGHEISALKELNLPKLCPNLEHVKLCVDQYDYDEAYEAEEYNQFSGPYGVDQSDVPLQIEFEYRGLWDDFGHEHLEFFYQIYPKMNKVIVLKWWPWEFFKMDSMFSDFHSLEYLEINVALRLAYIYDPDVAIAAILCGINYEEAKFLFTGTPRKNAKLNPCIVPIYASLFNAKNLTEVKITGERGYPLAFVNHSWVVQVTENLPVRHVRKLIVKFEGTEGLYKKLNYLRALTTLLGAIVKKN